MIREIWKAFKRYWVPTLDKIDALDLTNPRPLVASGERFRNPLSVEQPDFAATRSPRHIPWSRRRKELEASARQKRRQLESFREEA